VIFKNCVCIAQARVIEGKRKKAHICTIAYHMDGDQFIRVCLPFSRDQETGIRRWSVFAFDGDKIPNDTRAESYDFGRLLGVGDKLSEAHRQELHQLILSHYQYENELNEHRRSIGILLPLPGSLSFELSPLDTREQEYRKLMAAKGIFFPDFKLYVCGRRTKDGNPFRKQLLQWDVFEALRKGVDPFSALNSYRDPYIIMGNTPWVRNAFMAVSILSAPPKAKLSAHNQQLSLINAV
jgi:hypothetical protein